MKYSSEMSKADDAIRTYLTALRDPSALIDADAVAKLTAELDGTDDPIARIEIRQQLIDAKTPPTDKVEDAFVAHAKAWADKGGISPEAMVAEGVDKGVLRKAGFSISGGKRSAPRSASSKRVTADDVRSAIPSGVFTVKSLREISGASPAVVRKVINEETEAGNVVEQGPDPDHSGPGRAPVLYTRS